MDTAVIHLEDGVNGYVDLVTHVLNNGKEVSPRGKKTLEIEDAVITIDNIYNTLPLGVSRGTVAGIGAVEACQLLSGTTYPQLVIGIGPQFSNYVENNGFFHGAYGPRTRGQYDVMIDRLKADPSSRQAVVTIWNPQWDLQDSKKDYPCTILHQFRIRDDKLNMSVYMRSNDVWLGSAYDFFQFTRVQLAMASVLGIEPGTYAHHVGSLHLYEEHFEMAEALQYTDKDKIEKIPAITGRSWREVEASSLLAIQATMDNSLLPRLSESERWYADAMNKALEKTREKYTQMAYDQAQQQAEQQGDNVVYSFTPDQVVVEDVPESEVPAHIVEAHKSEQE
jgi:thymidylate synthase